LRTRLLGDLKLLTETLEYVEKTGRFDFDRLIGFEINRSENTFQRETERRRWIGDYNGCFVPHCVANG
jgi:hypothetical protein